MGELLGADGQPIFNVKEALTRFHQQDELLLQLLQQTRFDLLQAQLKIGFLVNCLTDAKLLPDDLDAKWKIFASAELEKLKQQEEVQQKQELVL